MRDPAVGPDQFRRDLKTHLFEWHCVSFSALAVFSRNALYKSTFYLLTYLLYDLGCVTSITKKQSFWFGLEPPTRRSQSKSTYKCIPYNNRFVQSFIQISWDMAVRGPKTCFWVKTEQRGLQSNLQQHSYTAFFTGWMAFLSPNQQCQDTKGGKL